MSNEYHSLSIFFLLPPQTEHGVKKDGAKIRIISNFNHIHSMNTELEQKLQKEAKNFKEADAFTQKIQLPQISLTQKPYEKKKTVVELLLI